MNYLSVSQMAKKWNMSERGVRKYCAENGQDGMKKRCHGKDGEDIIIKVPEGTIIKDAETGKVVADLS